MKVDVCFPHPGFIASALNYRVFIQWAMGIITMEILAGLSRDCGHRF